MKAVFFSHDLPELCEIRDYGQVWEPAANEVLIKNVVVASNPKDWKVPLWIPERSAVEGNDVTGYIETVGEGVTGFKKGDKVAAFTKMRSESKYGAYSEYSVSPINTVWHLADSTTFEAAATLPLAVMTAHIGLYLVLKLQLPPKDGSQGSARGVVIINGASSTVGVFAVQLAKRSGYQVVGLAGKSADLAKQYGVDTVVDYRGKSPQEIGTAVKAAAQMLGSAIVGIYDAVSSRETVHTLAHEVLQPGGGQITTVLPPYDNGEGLGLDNVTVIRTQVGWSHDEQADFAREWYPVIGQWLDEGSFKPMRARMMPNGLDSVREGIQLLRDNKVSGEKLLYRISDTANL